jgi:hypothetical protein
MSEKIIQKEFQLQETNNFFNRFAKMNVESSKVFFPRVRYKNYLASG